MEMFFNLLKFRALQTQAKPETGMLQKLYLRVKTVVWNFFYLEILFSAWNFFNFQLFDFQPIFKNLSTQY